MARNATKKRAHIYKNGLFYQLPFIQDEQGNYYHYPVSTGAPISPKKIKSTGCPVCSRSDYSLILKSFIKMQKQIQPTESALGAIRVSRNEHAATRSNRKQLNLILTNTDPNNSQKVFFGDGHGLVADDAGQAQVSPLIAVGGTWQKSTLAIFKSITPANPYDLHNLHIIAKRVTIDTTVTAQGQGTTAPFNITGFTDDDSFFTAGKLFEVRADVANNNPSKNLVPLSQQVNSNSFRTNIRTDENFRGLFDGFQALEFELPPLARIECSFYVSSVGTSYGMMKA